MGREDMKTIAAIAILAALATPALADDRGLITRYEQQLSDAITNGAPAVWEKYLDPGVVFAEDKIQEAPWGRWKTFTDPDGNGWVLQQNTAGFAP